MPRAARHWGWAERLSSARSRILPPEILWVAWAAALLFSDLPSAVMGEVPWRQGLRSALAFCLPYLTLTSILVVLYRRGVPRWLASVERRGYRIAFHFAFTGSVALAIGVLLYPAYRAIDLEPVKLGEWMVACVANAWALALPTMWLAHLLREVEHKKRLAIEAELMAVHAHINPHFLFNSLNTIASLIPENPRVAEEVVERFADILRYVLVTDHRRLVPLREEIGFARSLLELHGARFEGRLSSSFEIDPNGLERLVPSLLLEPLIENAILHGVAQRGTGQVDIVARVEGDWVIVEVRDNGVGLGGSAHQGSGVGLTNLRARLTLIYGKDASFHLESREGLTYATVRIFSQRDEVDEDPDR